MYAYSFGKMKFNWRMIFHTSMDSSTWYSPWEPCISQCYSSVGTYIAQLKSKNLYITIPLLLIIPSKSLILSELIYLCKCNRWSIDVGWASTWVKIVNEWFAATIYCKWVNILATFILGKSLTNGLNCYCSMEINRPSRQTDESHKPWRGTSAADW